MSQSKNLLKVRRKFTERQWERLVWGLNHKRLDSPLQGKIDEISLMLVSLEKVYSEYYRFHWLPNTDQFSQDQIILDILMEALDEGREPLKDLAYTQEGR